MEGIACNDRSWEEFLSNIANRSSKAAYCTNRKGGLFNHGQLFELFEDKLANGVRAA